jgi:hypothetical protein
MVSRKPIDEWSLVVQRQAQIIKQQEEEEKLAREAAKESYKKDLDYMRQMKDLEKQSQEEIRQREAQELSMKILSYQEELERKKQEETMLKKSLADTYSFHSNYIKQKDYSEKLQKLQEEQVQLLRLKQELEAEERRRREQREQMSQQDAEMMRYKEMQDRLRRENEQQEKIYDRQLAELNQKLMDDRERQYREYYKRKQEELLEKINRHRENVTTQELARQAQINKWISNAEYEHMIRQLEKEQKERELRQNNISNVAQSIRSQLEERNMKMVQDQQEKRRQGYEMEEKVQAYKSWEQQRDMDKKQQQQMYREQLAIQAAQIQEVRMNNYKLSEYERRVNRKILGVSEDSSTIASNGNNVSRSPLHATAAEILRSPVASEPSRDRSSTRSHMNGNFSQPVRMDFSPLQAAGRPSNNPVVDRGSYNPISNPINSSISRNRLF